MENGFKGAHTLTNENKCLLASGCKKAGTAQCNDLCPAYILMHGHSGNSGRVGSASTPKEYRLTTLSNSPAKTQQSKLYGMLQTYVKTFSRQFDIPETPKDRIKSLYLYSDETGTGKTTTASALLNEWIVRHFAISAQMRKQPLQVPAYFLDVNELQTLYNEFARQHVPQDVAEKASREYYRRLKLAKDAPFAVLDDIGVRTATEGFRGDLHSLINHRVTEQKVTIYTSNVHIEDLLSAYDKRLYDRARDMTMVMEFNGDSQRGMRK